MDTKDFLFITYSWHYSVDKFKYFEEMGHSIDIIDENTIFNFTPQANYKNVVVYLHDDYGDGTGVEIKRILNSDQCKDAFFIQSDDTDSEHVNTGWLTRDPDLIMHREYTKETVNPYNCPIYPFHFGYKSMEDSSYEKDIDICFVANMTNPRRIPFAEKLIDVRDKLPQFNWYINISGPHPAWEEMFGPKTTNYKEIVNRSKVGLHDFGNSFDATRIWELASCKTALIMPKMRQIVFEDQYMGSFDNYFVMRDDAADMEEKILEAFENDKYKEVAEKCYDDYQTKHNRQKVFDYYYNTVMKHCNE